MKETEKEREAFYGQDLECDCGGVMKPKVFNVEGSRVRGWECGECGRIDYSDDIDAVLQLRKLRGQCLEVVARAVGNSEVVTIPKPIAQLMGIRKGDRLCIRAESLTRFEVSKRERK